ncbi:MAG: hypothetical protein J6J33_01890 [Clostridia bacterium]|nr:hypothetical protein [Clostridia bacterium]
MEESKKYQVDGSVIEVEWNEAIYDCFVFNNKKIVVLRNEQFDEFMPAPTADEIEKLEKHFMLGQIYTSENVDYIFSLNDVEYDEALEYYIKLKKAYLGVADGN